MAKQAPKAKYVDGFVFLVPKKNLGAYKKLATDAGKVWMKHGALEYIEAFGEDLKSHPSIPIDFVKLAKPKKGELVCFSFITYKSRKHRDQVNAKVMKDPFMQKAPKKMPFDEKRMAYGGFEVLVNAK